MGLPYTLANGPGNVPDATQLMANFLKCLLIDGSIVPTANLPAGGFKWTGLAAGTTAGDSVRYEQVVGLYLLLSGGTLTGDLQINTQLLLKSSGGANTVTIKAPASLAGSLTMIMPNVAGANGQTLKTDGAGNLSWGAASTNIGLKNYLANSDAETDASSWNTYNDGAAAVPVDGTGGTATGVTFSRTTSSPLRGTGSFSLVKDAANRQGDGVSTDFTIDSADKAKVLAVSFDYNASSALVVGSASDISVWIYDVTNSVLIPVSPYQLQGNGTSNFKFQGVWQSNSNSTSYRLIIHYATANASATTLIFDNVVVGPQTYLYGAPIGDWTAYTPSYSAGFGTVSTQGAYYRRVGDSLEVQIAFLAGTTAASVASITLPSGMAIDTTKIANPIANSNPAGWGTCARSAETPASHWFLVFADGSTTDRIFICADAGSSGSGFTKTNGSSVINSTCYVVLRFIVPIAGWSSTVLMSNDTDTRVVAAKYSGSDGASVTTTATSIKSPTKEFDTHNAYNTATGVYTVPVSGIYRVVSRSTGNVNTTATVGSGTNIALYKNGTRLAYLDGVQSQVLNSSSTPFVGGEVLANCVAGDTLDCRIQKDTNVTAFTVNTGTDVTYVSFERLTGPSAIAATEKVACRYSAANTQAMTSNVNYFIDYLTKDYDTHGAVTNAGSGITTTETSAWRFTAPSSGYYLVQGALTIQSWTPANNAEFSLSIYVNGSQKCYLQYWTQRVAATSANLTMLNGSVVVFLNAGDRITFCGYEFGSSVNVCATAVENFVSITKQ